LTGISDAMVRGKPRRETVMPHLRAFLGEAICLAHNASFDQRFYHAEMDRANQSHDRQFVCSLLLARRLVQNAPNHKLGTLMQHLRLTVPSDSQAHRALADVHMTCTLWHHLANSLQHQLHGRALSLDLIRTISKKPKSLMASYFAELAMNAQPLHQTIPMPVG